MSHSVMNRILSAAAAALFLTWTSAAWATTRGPDAGNYTATDAIVYSFMDISGAGGGASVLSSTDDSAVPLNLPFSFQFYGQAYSIVCASTNGALYFVTDAAACGSFGNDFANVDLSAGGPPTDAPAVLPFWSDLTFQIPGAGAVFYKVSGSAGSRKFIVQWQNAFPQGSPNPVTFQLILSEGTNTVLFQYQNVDLGSGNSASNGGTSTIGIRNSGSPANSQAIAWSFDAPVLRNGTAISFSSTRPTTLMVNSSTGTYGGTVSLQASLSSGGVAIPNETISFTLGGGGILNATTGANGVALVANVSLSGLGAGTYTSGIAASFSGDRNYQSSKGVAALTVNRASLTITANPVWRYYGTANPPLSGTVTGLVAPDTVAVTYITSAVVNSPIGSYAIAPELSPNQPILSNYNPQLVSSTLTVGLASGLYVNNYACGALTMSGNAFTDSFDSSQGSYSSTKKAADGDVDVNGGTTLTGNVVINGALYTVRPTTGNCNAGNGVTLSGKAQATGGYLALTPTMFIPPTPSAASAPDTTISANTALPPGIFGNVRITGRAVVTLSPGTYSMNSITLTGNSQILVASQGAVILNITGSGSSKPIDLSGGSVGAPSGIPGNILINYGGTGQLDLSGQASSYAVLYAPNASAKLSGGSDWYGSIVVGTLDDSGGAAIHYDRHLGIGRN